MPCMQFANDLIKAGSVSGKAAFLCGFRPLENRREAVHRDALDDEAAIAIEHRRRQNIQRGSAGGLRRINGRRYFLGFGNE